MRTEPWRSLFEDRPKEDFEVAFAYLEASADRLLQRRMRTAAFWDSERPWAVWTEYGFVAKADINARRVRFHYIGASPLYQPSVEHAEVTGVPHGFSSESAATSFAGGWVLGDWEAYGRWNQGIFEHFFTEANRGRPVYLDVDDAVLSQIAECVGRSEEPRTSLARAVGSTLALAPDRENVFRAHLANLDRFQRGLPPRGWKQRESSPNVPPFLALLALFVRAAEEMAASDGYSAANYYGRLDALLGITSGSAASNRLRRHFQQHSLKFWHALNSWLEQLNGAVGLPTARSWGRRRYVGVPMSQALVKEHDRSALATFFAAQRFQPGRRLASADMERVLSDWITNSNVSGYLKTLWRTGSEARRRIAEVASLELENWDGTVPEPVDRARSQVGLLQIWAMLRAGPPLRIDIGLVAQASTPLPPGVYSLEPNASEQARNAIGDPPAIFVQEYEPGVGSLITEIGEWSLPELLLTQLSVSNEGYRLTRQPRAVVALERDDLLAAYREVDRLELATDAMILAHTFYAPAVEEVLKRYAVEGYESHDASQIKGLPNDWILYRNVQLVAPPTTDVGELSPLIGFSSAAVNFGDGLRLPGIPAWHRKAPPQLQIAVPDQSIDARLVIECLQLLNAEQDAPSLITLPGHLKILDIRELNLEDGDYEIRLETDDRAEPLATASLRIRSGDCPVAKFEPGFGYVMIEETIAPVSAERAEGVVLRGAYMDTDTERIVRGETPGRIDLPKGAIEDDLDVERSQSPRGPIATCAIGTTGHYFVLPPAKGYPRAKWIQGECKDCGLVKGFPTRPKLKSSPPRKDLAPVLVAEERKAHKRAEAPIDYNVLLDALTYAGSGSWSTFRQVASHLRAEHWLPFQALSTLSALGHIDVATNRRGLVPSMWSIAPASLAVLDNGSAVLAGARSQRLLDAIAATCDALGVTLDIEPQASGPDRVVVRADFVEACLDVAEFLQANHGATLLVSIRPDLLIASRLPSVLDVAATFEVVSQPWSVAAETFNPETATWESASGGPLRGPIRYKTRPRQYGFVASRRGGQMLSVDSRWAKWLGAAEYGWRLLSYDIETKTMAVPLGAGLPGLYERAVVLSSGMAPRIEDGVIKYDNVPPDVAGIIWNAIYGAR